MKKTLRISQSEKIRGQFLKVRSKFGESGLLMSVTITWAVPVCDELGSGLIAWDAGWLAFYGRVRPRRLCLPIFVLCFFFLDWAGWVSGAAPVHGTKSISFPWEHSAECNSTDKQMV